MTVEVRSSFQVDIVGRSREAVACAVADYGKLYERDSLGEWMVRDTSKARDEVLCGVRSPHAIRIISSDGKHIIKFMNVVTFNNKVLTRFFTHPGDTASVEPIQRTAALIDYLAEKYS